MARAPMTTLLAMALLAGAMAQQQPRFGGLSLASCPVDATGLNIGNYNPLYSGQALQWCVVTQACGWANG